MDHCISTTKTCQGMSKIHLTVSCVSHFYVRKYTFWKKCLFEGFVILHFVTHNVSFQNGMLKKHVFVCRRYCHHAKEVKRCSIEFFFLKKNVIPDFNAFFVWKKSSRAPTLFQHVHVHYMWVDKESSTNLNKLCTTVIDAATKAIKYCTCCHFYHMLLKDQSIYWHVYLTFIFYVIWKLHKC